MLENKIGVGKETLINLERDIEDVELEIKELKMLYKENKIPYKFLDQRIDELLCYVKEDIKQEIHI